MIVVQHDGASGMAGDPDVCYHGKESLQMWVKSSYSYAMGNCVEVQHEDSSVSVRDGKDPSGPVLTFTVGRWKAFIAGCRAGEFDSGA